MQHSKGFFLDNSDRRSALRRSYSEGTARFRPCPSWWALRSGDPTAFAKGKRIELADFKGSDPTGAPATLANADLVARGEYLTRAADCVACHTGREARLLPVACRSSCR